MRRAKRSEAANERGRLLADEGQPDRALDAYRTAVELDPANASAWFNMGLIHKHRREWGEAVQCGERAAQLQPDDFPTWWNLGIAATALGRWDLTRMAWRRCGVEVPDGDGPIEPLGLGHVPIRLRTAGDQEVVWAERLDPARARLENVPFARSGHRWHDIVLHDGVPVGERLLDGHAVPVFEELERLVPSDLPTLEVHVTAPSEADARALEELFLDRGRAAEDWSASVRHLCDSCSRGTVPAESSAGDVWDPRRHVGLAAHIDEAHTLLSQWTGGAEGRRAERPTAPHGDAS